MNLYFFANHAAAAFNMSRGDKHMRKLLEALPMKELKILQKHPDLGDRVLAIAKMDTVEVIKELQHIFNLDIEFHNNDDIWVSTEEVEEAIPEWFNSQHYGWFKSQRSGEFLDWAKNFLLQEVRINIWLRYMEHKKKNPVKPWIDMSGYAGYA